MQALPPPRKVKLNASIENVPQSTGKNMEFSQVRINPREMSGNDGVRERIYPSLRLPLVRIGAPYFRIAIRRQDANVDQGTFRNGNLLHFPTVYSPYGGGKRECSVCLRTNMYKSEACTGSESWKRNDVRSIDQRNGGMSDKHTRFNIAFQ